MALPPLAALVVEMSTYNWEIEPGAIDLDAQQTLANVRRINQTLTGAGHYLHMTEVLWWVVEFPGQGGRCI